MIDLRMIDVAIGIVFLYLLVSMVCSIIREAIENILNRRAANLEEAIRELFGDAEGTQGLSEGEGPTISGLYNHSLISVLYSGSYPQETDGPSEGFFSLKRIAPLRHLPTYIPSSTFALALIDLVARQGQPGHSAPLTIESLRENVDNVKNQTLKGALLIALDNADGKLERVRESIETWFNTAMDAVSARYRRNTNFIIFGIALTVSVGINVDTFRIADYLYRNTAVRDALVAMATEAAKRDDLPDFNAAKSALEATELPIGWSCGKGPTLLPCRAVNPSKGETTSQVQLPEEPAAPSSRQGGRLDTEQRGGNNFFELLSFVVGWLVTAFAATLGAPFWFDLLKKSIQARNIAQVSRRIDNQAAPGNSGEDQSGK